MTGLEGAALLILRAAGQANKTLGSRKYRQHLGVAHIEIRHATSFSVLSRSGSGDLKMRQHVPSSLGGSENFDMCEADLENHVRKRSDMRRDIWDDQRK